MKMKRRPVLSVFLWLAALGWVGLLFFFSGQNGVESGALSRRFTEFVLRAFPSLPYSVGELEPILRKMAHFGIFAVEGFLLSAAMMVSLRERGIAGILAAVSCAVVAALNEYHQSFMEGRSCALRDVFIDSAGAVVGVFFAALILFIVDAGVRRRMHRRANVII